jgi:hypothetical protein
LVKVRKYEGKTDKVPPPERGNAREKRFWRNAAFALAGFIVILALGDLEILFTSY